MKTLKTIIILAVATVFVFSKSVTAQEKQKLDKEPRPKGGIEAIVKNVVYPEDAKKSKIEGKVFVKAIVDEKGDVVSAEILEGNDNSLNDAAINAIKATKFTPGMKEGKFVQAEVVIPIKFKLK